MRVTERQTASPLNTLFGVSTKHTNPIRHGATDIFFGRGNKPHKITHYVLGDIHLNNHEWAKEGINGRKTEPKVLEKLQEISERHQKEQAEFSGQTRTVVVLNGDIFDLIESMPIDPPWRALPQDEKLKRLKETLDSIARANPQVITKFKELLAQPNLFFVYNIGNHERWLSLPELQTHLKENILELSAPSKKLKIGKVFYDPLTKTAVVHGQQFDPHYPEPEDPFNLNLGEKIDLELIKPIFDSIPKRIKAQGYGEETIEAVKKILRTIEYVRPVHQGFLYAFGELQKIGQTTGKDPKEILVISLEELLKAYRDNFNPPNRIKSLIATDRALQKTARWIATPAGRIGLNLLATGMIKKVRSNKNQKNKAKKFLKQFQKDVRVLVLGHTHKVLVDSIPVTHKGQTYPCIVLNPSCFKPTILFPNPNPTYPSGMVRVTWDKEHPETHEVHFDLSEKRVIYHNQPLSNLGLPEKMRPYSWWEWAQRRLKNWRAPEEKPEETA